MISVVALIFMLIAGVYAYNSTKDVKGCTSTANDKKCWWLIGEYYTSRNDGGGDINRDVVYRFDDLGAIKFYGTEEEVARKAKNDGFTYMKLL